MGKDSDRQGSRMDGVNRRTYLQSVASATAGGGLAAVLSERAIAQTVAPTRVETLFDQTDDDRESDAVFPQSVMSGGPTTSGVILWTRVDPSVVTAGIPLHVEVATEDTFTDVVYRGEVSADRLTSSHDYAVSVDLDGELDSNTRYRYRFIYDGTTSRTGRCRTLPDETDNPGEVSFAVASCQDYQNGYYGAYAHIAREDVDFLLHMGDFIYESANGMYTGPGGGIEAGRDFELPSENALAETLQDFRALYKTYKSDPLLQSALEAHTLIAGWDDHEIGNNRYWDYADRAPVLPDKPGGDDPEFALELTANGIQAWVEHMPARVDYDPTADHLHDQFQLYRTMEFGDLVNLLITDERLFRDGPACEGDRLSCHGEDSPHRTMLGALQKEWWKTAVTGSTGTWTVWQNAVLTMPLTLGSDWYQVEILQDSWDGYQAERHTLMQHIADSNVENFVTLTGDLHCSLAGYMKSHYGDVESGSAERVGIELVTPAISSVTADSLVDYSTPWDSEALNDLAVSQNEHVNFMDWYRNGYAVVTFTHEECRYTAYEVDASTDSADAARTKLAEYRVPVGEIELNEEYNIFDKNVGSGWF